MRRFLVLTLLLVSSSFGARAAYACSCIAQPELLGEAVAQSELAFNGQVTSALGGGVYAVRVFGVLKGEVGPSVRLKAQGGNEASCGGVRLPEGPIVYAGSRELTVSLCTWLRTGDDVAPAMAASRMSPSPPLANHPTIGPEPPFLGSWLGRLGVLVLAAVVVAGGVVVVARRRRPAYAG